MVVQTWDKHTYNSSLDPTNGGNFDMKKIRCLIIHRGGPHVRMRRMSLSDVSGEVWRWHGHSGTIIRLRINGKKSILKKINQSSGVNLWDKRCLHSSPVRIRMYAALFLPKKRELKIILKGIFITREVLLVNEWM